MDQSISAACGAGAVLVCESEYLCWKLFKRKNIFFFVCQLAILSSAIATAVNGVIHLVPDVPMFIVMLIVGFIMVTSYPIVAIENHM
jgi:ribose/xylose/arabinose/galactoside ABC-type transport system permease subunit